MNRTRFVFFVTLWALWMVAAGAFGVRLGVSTANGHCTTASINHSLQGQRNTPGLPITKKKIEQADISILFIGNSHATPPAHMLRDIFNTQLPEQKVLVAMAPSWGFLAQHAERNSTIGLIKRGPWDFVVLQAQKYSTSGKYSYPYDGALKLSKIASEQGAKVIMFPEWSRRAVPQEYLRINRLHDKIAGQTGAVVAPIGQTWERALKRNGDLKLYASDGNHASPLGSYLNACVFFSMISGNHLGSDVDQADASDKTALKHLLGDSPSNDPNLEKTLLQQAAWAEVEKLIDAGKLKITKSPAASSKKPK